MNIHPTTMIRAWSITYRPDPFEALELPLGVVVSIGDSYVLAPAEPPDRTVNLPAYCAWSWLTQHRSLSEAVGEHLLDGKHGLGPLHVVRELTPCLDSPSCADKRTERDTPGDT